MINNDFYKDLGERWFEAEGDAVALLRLENITKEPWVRKHLGPGFERVLDVGCGGGFLSLGLARAGFDVTALDLSEDIIRAGRRRDERGAIRWVTGSAEKLPFADGSFDAVCVMDVLEHVNDPRVVLFEAARVLRPGGKLLLHTFNRTWRSWLFAARGLDWFFKDSPKHIHEWSMFLRPREVEAMLKELDLRLDVCVGINPVLFSTSFLKLLWFRAVPKEFRFKIGGGTRVGYLMASTRS